MRITEMDHRSKHKLKLRPATEKIVIHHSASQRDTDAADIHIWHLNKGWSGIGYHFVIRRSGEIQRGRLENMIGAHAQGSNADSIGVCVVGDFNVEQPTPGQMQSLTWLIRDLEDTYGQLDVIRHKDVVATACPGDNFPWEHLRVMVRGGPQDAQDNVSLEVNGRPVQLPLCIIDGRTKVMLSGAWVQLRDLADLLQAEIGWDKVTRTVNLIIK